MRLSSVEAIAHSLNETRVPFIVVGGLAVNAHGYGRATQDVDLVVNLEPELVKRLFGALERLGYRPRVPVTAEGFGDPETRAGWIAEKGMTVLNFQSDQHRETPIDIFVTEPFDFPTEYQLSLVEDIAPGIPMRIVRLVTLLKMKRAVARPQDIADVAELEQINRKPDQ